MKNQFSVPIPWIIALAAMLFVQPMCLHALGAQESLDKSEIVQIEDPEQAFFGKVDDIRTIIEEVGNQSHAWQRAEKAARDLTTDPNNAVLKRQMIDSRVEVIGEKLDLLRRASDHGANFETSYKNFSNQLDAQILDAKASVEREGQFESKETNFLSDSLDQLMELEKHLPASADNRLVSTNPSAALSLTEVEKQKLAEFKQQLEAAETQLELARNATDLQNRRMAVLAEIKLQAAREYLGIRRAISTARSDQIAFMGIARNDLAYLKLLDDEDRLSAMTARKPIDYSSPAKAEFLRGGYRFNALGSSTSDDSVDPKVMPNSDDIRRIREKLNERPNSPASSSVAQATEKKEKK